MGSCKNAYSTSLMNVNFFSLFWGYLDVNSDSWKLRVWVEVYLLVNCFRNASADFWMEFRTHRETKVKMREQATFWTSAPWGSSTRFCNSSESIIATTWIPRIWKAQYHHVSNLLTDEPLQKSEKHALQVENPEWNTKFMRCSHQIIKTHLRFFHQWLHFIYGIYENSWVSETCFYFLT